MGLISRLHAFPKPEAHLTHQTLSGGIVTTLGVLTALVLFLHELHFFLTPTHDYKMSVDTTSRGGKLPVYFDITFPAMPCNVLELDTADASGEGEMDIHGGSVHKTKLDSQGTPLEIERMETGKKKKNKKRKGAEKQRHNLPVPKEESHESQDPWEAVLSMFNFTGMESDVQEMQTALDAKEGCRLTGSISVPRLAGTLHISVHVHHFYVVQRLFPTSERINMSHIIHNFGFGQQFPGRVDPLDGLSRIIHPLEKGEKEDNSPHQIGTFKYFLKVVPTKYNNMFGKSLDTNQYSVSEYFSPVDVLQFGNLPSINFVYDLSPITMTINEERENIFSFLTRLCAVLGGSFALTGMLNKLVYAGVQRVAKQSKQF